jgi:putative DNA primase/helicase
VSLYRRFEIAAAPGKAFVLCSSEESADAAHTLIGRDYVATTCNGNGVDLTPLINREGLLIPDNTAEAIEHMRLMAARLLEIGCTIKGIIDPTDQQPEWTIAEWRGSEQEFRQWGGERRRDYTPPTAAVEPPHDDIPIEAYEDERPKAAPQPFSEDHIAQVIARRCAEDWRYVKAWNKWLKWDSSQWRIDEIDEIANIAREVCRQAATEWDGSKNLTDGARRGLSQKRYAWNARDMAGVDPALAAKSDQWDADPWILGVPGGVVDLKTGSLTAAERTQYVTKRAAVLPQEGEPRLWIKFLERITGGDESLSEYLQRFAGYALTGATSEHALAFLYGTGANGKTTFLHTLSGVLGDYAVSAGFEVFAESKGERHPTEIARLRGARLVVTEETDAGGRWNEGRVKRLTGGGKISAHFMRQDDFEFEPQFKLLIAGNHKPVIKAVDEAIKRRIHLIPFTVTIPPEERDKELLDKLRAEWPQILSWAIRGCLAWQERSLSPPERIRDATEQYVESEDILGAWLEECCERDGEAEGRNLYDSYRKWCDDQGEHCWSRRGWANAMIERGFGQRKSDSRRMFVGVSLKLGSNLP